MIVARNQYWRPINQYKNRKLTMYESVVKRYCDCIYFFGKSRMKLYEKAAITNMIDSARNAIANVSLMNNTLNKAVSV